MKLEIIMIINYSRVTISETILKPAMYIVYNGKFKIKKIC